MHTIKRLVSYLYKHWLAAIGAVAGVLISTGLGLIPPWLIRFGIDNYILANKPQFLWIIGISMVGITLLQTIFEYLKKYIAEYIAQDVIHEIRYELYQHLNKLSFAFYDSARTGDLMARVTADANKLQGFMANVTIYMAGNILTIIGIFIIVTSWDYRLALVYLLMIPFMLFGMYQYSTRVRPMFKKARKNFSWLNNVIQEDLLGIELIKLFAREKEEEEDFKIVNREYAKVKIDATRVSACWMPYINFFMGTGTALVIWYAGRLIINNEISLGVLVGFTAYIPMLLRPIRKTGMMINFSNQAIAAAERIFAIIDKSPEIKNKINAAKIPKIKGEVEFNNVSFSYENGKKILHNINFSVKPGETIAIVGPTGAGKTTLIHLIPRFYDPDQGEILIDGHNIKNITIDSLRKQIGVVLQHTYLFGASIKENISYGKPNALMEEIVSAAKVAQLDDYIQSLPLGYETPVGERGVSLSGGQKQRLAMARVILTDPGLLIFDEPTSNIDTDTEEKMQQALKEVTKGRTTFVIAHRLWTIKQADKILVVKEGEIIESGSHDELLAAGGFYSQANHSKLANDFDNAGDAR